MTVRMPHGHGAAGENPPEILAFANSIFEAGRAVGESDRPRRRWVIRVGNV